MEDGPLGNRPEKRSAVLPLVFPERFLFILTPTGMSIKIITFGDSTTALRPGVHVYTDQLAERLADCSGIEWVNKGVGGNSTRLAAERFDKDVIGEAPDLVVMQFGLNDAAVDVWKTPPATESRVSKAEYVANLISFIERIQEKNGQVILMTPNQMRWTPRFREMYGKPPYRLDDEKGFTFIVAEYAELVRELAAKFQLPLVDVYALYDAWESESGKSCMELTTDGQHPNTAGHTLIVDQLEPLIRTFLKSVRSSPN